MSELRKRLEQLGLAQYADIFIAEGFDTWDILLDIQESDLEYLAVKLGHRRKLQRAIAEYRGIAPERALSANRKASLDASYRSDDSAVDAKESKDPLTATPAAGTPGTKRKYRRHPKSDENAPERPASAYVIFSNLVREELKGRDLSFTEIAKTVGERWQLLQPVARDEFERQAAAAKEKYYAELAEYKKTPQYAQYQEYLADFKAKHAAPRAGMPSYISLTHGRRSPPTEGKRAKLEPQTSTSTRSSSQGDAYERSEGGRSSAPSIPDGQGPNLTRSDSTSTAGGPFPAPQYHLPSASASPAAYSSTLHSPIGRDQYSPKAASSPAATAAYTAYELPHHARSISTIDSRYREPAPPAAHSPHGPQSAYWLPPIDSDAVKPRLPKLTSGQGAERPPASLPSLMHPDTVLSPDSGILPGPYQSSLLPALDAPKADRMLPQPIPTAGLGALGTLPLGHGQAQQQQLQQQQLLPPVTTSVQRAGQWPALLRASELARDADLQDSSSRDDPST